MFEGGDSIINPFNVFTTTHCPSTSINTPLSHNQLSTTEEIINIVGEQHHLEKQQWIAFRIITRSFLENHLNHLASKKTNPLRMLLTGPGGTGKSHVVKAVHKVMEHYRVGHTIRFLAPTGSAASLIDGIIVHKGLGIKVKSTDKGKGNRKLADNQEDYSVVITTQNKTKLRDEWRLVEIVMIDECSLLSAELLSEIDAALRFSKEVADEWFGGITVIFAGDFFQYPPVCATPLYNPITTHGKNSDSELAKRIGRLAWKSLNAVMTFTQQKRMETDPQYVSAVTHLRTRECTLDDIDLFNSRIVKSSNFEHGILMNEDTNFNATAIVRTNLLRQTMNIRKAQTNASKYNLSLVNCAAIDTCSTTTLTQSQIDHLLRLDMSSSHFKDALPGFLPLYIGMPVILRCKNISTDLGITNGSQGYVRHFTTKQTSFNICYCTCAIVEFPNSKVSLPNLSPTFFPITPIKTSFTTQLVQSSGDSVRLKIMRSQLPIQPAFAVTGHSAQGKTLPSVLTDLKEGGFAAYVAASRPRSRQGLFLTEAVTLDDLNKKHLPYNLLQECKRLNALEHNTYIHYGFQDGALHQVPDPESERHITRTSLIANFNESLKPSSSNRVEKDALPSQPKRKRQNNTEFSPHPKQNSSDQSSVHNDIISMSHELTPSPPSNRRRLHNSTAISTANHELLFSAGCTWCSDNWSCAYDSIIMAFFYGYVSLSHCIKEKWRQQTSLTHALVLSFDHLKSCNDHLMSSIQFNIVRDQLRDYLSSIDPTSFPRYGRVGASAEQILTFLKDRECPTIRTVSFSSLDTPLHPPCPPISSTNNYLPTIFFNSLWTKPSRTVYDRDPPRTASTQEWLDMIFEAKLQQMSNSSERSRIYLDDPPPFLTFETVPHTAPLHLPSFHLDIKSSYSNNFAQYHLSAIIYHGNYHFTARIIDPNKNVYTYDGQKKNGFPSFESKSCDIKNCEYLTEHDGRSAHLYIYSQST